MKVKQRRAPKISPTAATATSLGTADTVVAPPPAAVPKPQAPVAAQEVSPKQDALANAVALAEEIVVVLCGARSHGASRGDMREAWAAHSRQLQKRMRDEGIPEGVAREMGWSVQF